MPRRDALEQQAKRVVVLDVQTDAVIRDARGSAAPRGAARAPACTALIAAAIALIAAAVALAACKVDESLPPTSAAATADAESREATRLRDHILATPGVASASVVVELTATDPFARTPKQVPARVAIVVATRAGADTGVIGDAAQAAAHTALGADADVQVQIAPPPQAPRLVSVGPFDVTPATRTALVVTLVITLLLVGILAAALALALVVARRRVIGGG
jgi:hypothetical protein